MGKQKQQFISRFFAPKPKNASSPSSSSPSVPSPNPNPPTPPPKVSATVSFSPAKRIRSSKLASPKNLTNSQLQNPSKKPKLSPHTQNPIPPLPNPSLHQKFIQKLLEPSTSSPQTAKPPPPNLKYTPLEQQVVDLKAKYPDVLLMIEVGYKYRFFGEDAEIAARVLGIYAHVDHNFLTASIPTFRLNVHVRRLVSVGYKVGVVKQTETAAIKAHGTNRLGPFCRGLSALYTKATIEAAEDVGGGEEGCGSSSNYLLCVVEKGVLVENEDCGVESGFDVRIGLIAVEISTGDVVHGEFNDNVMRSGLESVVLSLSPAEILIGDPLSRQTEKLLLAYAGPASNVRVERASRNCFCDGGALAEVMSLYEKTGDDATVDYQEQNSDATERENNWLGIEGIISMPELAVQALALTIRHLKQFGLERILCLGASFRPFSTNMEMSLSANALQQLEVLKNNSDGSETGSLLQLMNHTLTIFGSRLLRHWVTHPLCDRSSIYARLNAVSEIADSIGLCRAPESFDGPYEKDSCVTARCKVIYLLSSVLTTLGRSPDIQRGITRIFHQTATASEFVSVMHAILDAGKQFQQLNIEEEDYNGRVEEQAVHSALLRRLILTVSSSTVIGHAAKLLAVLNKDAADQGDLENLFNVSNGQFPEVTRAQTSFQIAKEKLDLLIGLYRKQLGMHNLEFMSVSGSTHLVELPSNVKVPLNWIKVNSTKKTVRYHPPEVLTALDRLSLAKEELAVACRAAWDSFLMGFGKYYPEFQAAVQALAALDCLHSLAILSRNKNYVCPTFVDDDEPVQIHIRSGRHPVLEAILQDNFVPNDTDLHADREYCQIVTGPNMGGKSCYIRQVALIAIMAQVGSFVPASSVKLHVLDGIYTRMGASDNIQQGRSTFLEELSEASYIFHNCTSRSLVIIDELGRGTSTHDGIAIAYAILHHLVAQKRCMVLFVTHYPKIVDIKDEFPGSVGSCHVSYLTSQKTVEIADSKSDQNVEDLDQGNLTFLYKVVPGTSDKSFGLNVARLAQLPYLCISRAAVMAAKLEEVVSTRMAHKLLLGTPSVHEELVAHENFFASNYCSNGNGFSACSSMDGMEGLEELADLYHKFFIELKSAVAEVASENCYQSLKRARIIALSILNR
ncbi:DNA mismatch repair protein MSH3 isoform X1 [Telopea speciosissima]|uniref:DNA mismatch repair protein MSH3 isoform X1 n=1 Tax=Telopea speciosissima TaxID=54955 RepID=UPI001CC70B31|nr:DNA mismatch repair protein MSH3 isoform X1 [Telopea speciosissima]